MVLFCRLFLDTNASIEDVNELLRTYLNARIDKGSVISTFGSYDLMKNESYDTHAKSEFPDGFTFFPYTIEIEPEGEKDSKLYIEEIGNLLTKLWKNAIPAVAACDFENELPENGGYKSRNVPWTR